MSSAAWCSKHRPRRLRDLSVAPKKVNQVKQWLEDFRSSEGRTGADPGGGKPRVLVLTGPTGAGKSLTVELICREAGTRLLQWNAPTPTLWHEHAYHKDLGNEYFSKLREFEEFLRRSTMLSQIPMASAAASPSIAPAGARGGAVVLIDDLPATHSFDHHSSLLSLLDRFSRTTRFPIVLCLSNLHRIGERDSQSYYQDRIVKTLQSSGLATVLSFPGITSARTLKVLERVSESEGFLVEESALRGIAEASNGDVRNALTSLEFSVAGDPLHAPGAIRAKKRKRKKGGKKDEGPSRRDAQVVASRDRELDLFHVLGKILYNKRAEGGELENRAEDVIVRSHLDAGGLLAYLHENFVDFVGDDSIDEAGEILQCFSDAAFLTGDGLGNAGLGANPSSLVGVLGYQCAKGATKVSLGFHTMRKPAAFDVERARARGRCLHPRGGDDPLEPAAADLLGGEDEEDEIEEVVD
ncbi:cell cycle checkpoint protein RAD17 [Chloropicon primus]|nr:cell cycle checkpoint protein RAD17 [Chloropicon primus]